MVSEFDQVHSVILVVVSVDFPTAKDKIEFKKL